MIIAVDKSIEKENGGESGNSSRLAITKKVVSKSTDTGVSGNESKVKKNFVYYMNNFYGITL